MSSPLQYTVWEVRQHSPHASLSPGLVMDKLSLLVTLTTLSVCGRSQWPDNSGAADTHFPKIENDSLTTLDYVVCYVSKYFLF